MSLTKEAVELQLRARVAELVQDDPTAVLTSAIAIAALEMQVQKLSDIVTALQMEVK